ncbi:histidine kinase/DNA gyrase B/HSP90-like ATPase [Actinocorallia herbida]|uniref:histidine kinase n=1 Tax=Actinocorallia herbida TaxID=58109 RepID=A0A3N1D441_9ACTN|nr:histidine kinase [Actinocorallia herbida]ROO88304.1 histidine kinase/DNA gyrase B/HSP90-like ATPase [Actinocorallia herbida]
MRIPIAAGLGVATLAVVAGILAPAEPPYREPDPLGWVLFAISMLALVALRASPLGAFAATCSVLVANAAAGFPATFVHWPLWIALCACFSRYGDPRRRAAAVGVFLAGLAGFLAFDREPSETLSGIAVGFLIATVGGDALRSRRAYAEEAEARLLLEERSRLARELHDALGHAVTVMVMQASVGRKVFASNPEFGREALRHIETLGRGALEELDQVLRALDGAPSGPPDLAALAERVRAAGRDLDLEVDLGDAVLGAETARALHRIVQEAVTNALRHSASGRIRIGLARDGGRVRLDVVNEGTGFADPEPGRGMAGMRRRATEAGGEFHAGATSEGFAVRVVLPEAA